MTDCKYWKESWGPGFAGRCSAPDDVKTNTTNKFCISPKTCPFLLNQMKAKEIQKQIEELQAKLEELENQKLPVEEAFKDNYGVYPDELKSNDDFNCWMSFKRGYIAAKKDKESEYQPSMVNCILKGCPPEGYVDWNEWYNELGSKGILHNLKISSKEVEVDEWKDVALKFGEKLPAILPYNYDELSPAAWFRWVVFTYEKYMEQRDKECGYTPKTQEQVEKLQKKDWSIEVNTQGASDETKPLLRQQLIDYGFQGSAIEDIILIVNRILPKPIKETCGMKDWDNAWTIGYNNYRDVLVSKLK